MKNKKEKNLERQQMIGNCFIIIQDGEFPQKIKPIKVKKEFICAISGRKIYPGDYAYPCRENPVIVREGAPSRSLVSEVLKSGNDYLEAGAVIARIKTRDEVLGIKKLARRNEIIALDRWER